MTDYRQLFLLSWVESYYPLIYQDENTNKLKGSSITFFDIVKDLVKDIRYEDVHYNDYREPNRTMANLGGAMGAIVDGKLLTELSGAFPDETYLKYFDLSPVIGVDELSFYEADIGSVTWSPISYFIPFTPLTFILVLVTVIIPGILQIGNRKPSSRAAAVISISSSFFLLGITILLVAYNAGFQGTLIAADPVEIISYDNMLSKFESGEKLWYFRTTGELDLSSIPNAHINIEGDLNKLIALMCEKPGKVIASLFECEYLQLQLYDPPKGCQIRKVNLVAPSQPSPTYHNFESTLYYFLLPKKLPKKLRNAINFVANSVFQADQRDGYFMYASVDTRSFVDLTPQQRPLADYSPLSIHSLGVIVLIFLCLQFIAIIMFVIEILVHRFDMKMRFRQRYSRSVRISVVDHVLRCC